MNSATFMPSNLLQNLKCKNCKQYLSTYPIYSNDDGTNNCGRCSSEGVKNESYQTAITFLSFPCSNDINGCLECFIPSKMLQHEKKCQYRKEMCPTKYQTDCDWKGNIENYVTHFENNHPTLILKQQSFEIDFINDYVDVCLIPYADNWFLLRKEGNCTLDSFWCSVECIDNNDNGAFNFSLIFQDTNKIYSHQTEKKLVSTLSRDNSIQVVSSEIQNLLDNPCTIIASLEIVQDENPLMISDEYHENNPNINYEMLKILECPVCFLYMVPPIFQCAGGHSICKSCRVQIGSCPTCRKPIGDTQNFAVESFTSLLSYPCRNAEIGCDFYSNASQIKDHEELCRFGSYVCPLSSYDECMWIGLNSDILAHCRSQHSENVLDLDTVSMPFCFDNDNNSEEDCYILKFLNDIFLLHFKYFESRFCWSLQLLGPPNECKNFNFDIDVIDNSGKNLRAYLRGQCSSLTNKTDAFNNNSSYIYFDYKQIKNLINDHFTYKCHILKNEV